MRVKMLELQESNPKLPDLLDAGMSSLQRLKLYLQRCIDRRVVQLQRLKHGLGCGLLRCSNFGLCWRLLWVLWLLLPVIAWRFLWWRRPSSGSHQHIADLCGRVFRFRERSFLETIDPGNIGAVLQQQLHHGSMAVAGYVREVREVCESDSLEGFCVTAGMQLTHQPKSAPCRL